MTQGLQLDHIEIRKGSTLVVAADLSVPPGTVTTLMGPSGRGKSLLINALAGFLPPDFGMTGRVLIDGQDLTGLPPERRHLGLLFQDPLLFPHLDVAGNIAFAVPPGPRAERRARVEALLGAARMQDFAHRDPATLSGGEKARIALLRVLAARPRALLLDEPFSKLDPDLRQALRQSLFALVRANNLPVLLVTHDPADAEAAAGPVVQL